MINNRIVNRDMSKISIVGRIKIGEKDEAKGYPKSLDYFKATGNFAANFTAAYGEKPNKLLIFFPSHNALSQQYTLYVDGKRYGVSDGLNFEYYQGGNKNNVSFQDTETAQKFMDNFAASIDKKQKSKPVWKLTVKLTFVLAEIRNINGLWSFESGGVESMVNQITNSFDDAINLFENIIGVPFWLSVTKVKHLSAKSDSAKIFPVVTLNPAISYGQLYELKNGANSVAQIIENTIKMLSPNVLKAINTTKDVKQIAPAQEIKLKQFTDEQYNKIHESIENGKYTVQELQEMYAKKGYYVDLLVNARSNFLEMLQNSIDDIGEINNVLQSKGYYNIIN